MSRKICVYKKKNKKLRKVNANTTTHDKNMTNGQKGNEGEKIKDKWASKVEKMAEMKCLWNVLREIIRLKEKEKNEKILKNKFEK